MPISYRIDLEQPDGQTEFNQVFRDENDDTRVPWEGLFSDISIATTIRTNAASRASTDT